MKLIGTQHKAILNMIRGSYLKIRTFKFFNGTNLEMWCHYCTLGGANIISLMHFPRKS